MSSISHHPGQQKWRYVDFKMADLRHLEYLGYNKEFFEKHMLDFL